MPQKKKNNPLWRLKFQLNELWICLNYQWSENSYFGKISTEKSFTSSTRGIAIFPACVCPHEKGFRSFRALILWKRVWWDSVFIVKTIILVLKQQHLQYIKVMKADGCKYSIFNVKHKTKDVDALKCFLHDVQADPELWHYCLNAQTVLSENIGFTHLSLS